MMLRVYGFILMLLPFVSEAGLRAQRVLTSDTGEMSLSESRIVLQESQTKILCETIKECRYEAVYKITNPTADAEEALLLWSAPSDDVDGARANAAEESTQTARAFKTPSPSLLEMLEQKKIVGALVKESLRIEPGEVLRVEVNATLHVSERITHHLPLPLYYRHLKMAKRDMEDSNICLQLFFQPQDELQFGEGAQLLTIQAPKGWELYGMEKALEEDSPSGTQQRTTSLPRGPSLESIPTTMSVGIYPKVTGFFKPGGLLLGAGIDAGAVAGRFRAGYELGVANELLLFSAQVEATTKGDVFAVPSFGMFLGGGLSPLVLGLSLGAPVRVTNDVGVLIRTQFDIALGPIGVSIPIDVDPTINRKEDGRRATSFLLQISI